MGSYIVIGVAILLLVIMIITLIKSLFKIAVVVIISGVLIAFISIKMEWLDPQELNWLGEDGQEMLDEKLDNLREFMPLLKKVNKMAKEHL